MSRYSELLRERIENSGYKDAELANWNRSNLPCEK